MQHLAWRVLFGYLPEEQYSNLMLVTRPGVEISIQTVFRIDPECLAIKGRIAGTDDDGKIFFVPYDQIVYLGFQKPLKEAEFKELFDDLTLPEPFEPPEPVEAAPSVPSLPTPRLPPSLYNGAPVPLPHPPSAPGPAPTVPRAPVKSDILERFRAKGSHHGNGKGSDQHG